MLLNFYGGHIPPGNPRERLSEMTMTDFIIVIVAAALLLCATGVF